MATTDIITDPTLTSVFAAAAEARAQCLQMLAFIEQHSSVATESDELLAEAKNLNARIAILRGVNRKAVMSVRATKQATSVDRTEVDELHLQLGNLYYEQRHLRGEIRACEGFDHKYLSLPLVPVDEFLALHPEYNEASDHDLTIARINDEAAARQVLEERRQALVKRKETLVKETNAKKEELGKLDAEIEKWVAGEAGPRKVFEARDRKIAERADQEPGTVS